MKTMHRCYAEVAGDFNRLSRFITANNTHLRRYSTWSLGRFVDWKYGLYESKQAVPAFCDQNAHLWFDAFDELAGFAISEQGGADVAIVLAEGYRFLFEDMLHWTLEHWGKRAGRISTEITERQTREMEILEHYGFRRGLSFATACFDLTVAPAPHCALEAGFRIVDMRAHPNYREQRLLRDDGFGGTHILTEEELQRHLLFYNYTHSGPIYHPECDLCVMAADGTFVAGCEALIDARNAEADIERVCTRTDFRRRGFARAVIHECLVRLRALGLRAAYITGYSPEAIALYGSLGAVEERQNFMYERNDG